MIRLLAMSFLVGIFVFPAGALPEPQPRLSTLWTESALVGLPRPILSESLHYIFVLLLSAKSAGCGRLRSNFRVGTEPLG